MKKILLSLLAVLMCGGPAFAGSSRIIATYTGTSAVVQLGGRAVVSAGQSTDPATLINTRGSLVYNITCNAQNANVECDLYDSNQNGSYATYEAETPVYEVKVATANDSKDVDMSGSPLSTFSGLVAIVQGGGSMYINGQF